MAIDLMWTAGDISSEVSITHSTLSSSHGDGLRVFYLLAADVAQDYSLTPAHLGMTEAEAQGSFIAYEYCHNPRPNP